MVEQMDVQLADTRAVDLEHWKDSQLVDSTAGLRVVDWDIYWVDQTAVQMVELSVDLLVE